MAKTLSNKTPAKKPAKAKAAKAEVMTDAEFSKEAAAAIKQPKKAKANGEAKAKTSRKGSGHNSNIDRVALRKFFERLDKVHGDKETVVGEFNSKIKDLYETAANDLGVKRTIIRDEYHEHRHEMKRQAKYKEMDSEEQRQTDMVRLALASFGDTPLGQAAIDRVQRQEAAVEMAAD